MADDPTLRSLFRSIENAPDTRIDVKAVLRRSRRRRLPAQLGVGAVGLVAAGVLVVGVTAGIGGIRSNDIAGSADSAADSAPEVATGQQQDSGASALSTQDGLKLAPVDKLNACGGTLAEVDPSDTGLTLTTRFDDVAADATSVTGTVTLSNTGTETWLGSTALYPAITLSQGGVTVWHSNGGMDGAARLVDLAPGRSMEYQASFEAVRCEVADDLREQFRSGLPRVEPGAYQVSAAIHFRADEPGTGLPEAELVTGPAQTITIH